MGSAPYSMKHQRQNSNPGRILLEYQEALLSDLKTRFEQAAEDAKRLPRRPDNDTMLRLYALYKQSTAGDASGKRPGFTDIVGRAKYDAWVKTKGMGKDAAMQAYIDLVEKLGRQ